MVPNRSFQDMVTLSYQKVVNPKFSSVINNFFSHESKPYNYFVFIDIRHEPQKIDLEFF